MGVYKPKGSKFYWFSITHDGVRHRENTQATNRKLADRIYHQRVNELAGKQHFPDEKEKNISFAQLMERYLSEVTPDKTANTQADDRRYAATLEKFFSQKNLNQVVPDLVFQYKQKRKLDFANRWKEKQKREKKRLKKLGKEALKKFEAKDRGYGNRTINRELNFLSAAFNQAIKVWGWAIFNPVSSLKREEENKRVKYFPEEQFAKIFACLPEWVKPIVLFAKNTGLRRANVVNLEWSQVDLEQRMVILDAEVMKNSEHFGVPLNDWAWEVLLAQQERPSVRSQFVFCKSDGVAYTPWGVTRAFKRACRKAGCPDFRFHDLRHDFCSQLVQRGVDLYVVKELAGHKDISTTQRYAHLSPAKLKSAVAVLVSHAEVKVEKMGYGKNRNPLI